MFNELYPSSGFDKEIIPEMGELGFLGSTIKGMLTATV
jgi:hypothetical protein